MAAVLKVQQGGIKEVVVFAIRQIDIQNSFKLANPKRTSAKLCCKIEYITESNLMDM